MIKGERCQKWKEGIRKRKNEERDTRENEKNAREGGQEIIKRDD